MLLFQMEVKIDLTLIVEAGKLASYVLRFIPPLDDDLREYWKTVLAKTICDETIGDGHFKLHLRDKFIEMLT
jgi:hypothetical protein